MKTVRQMATRGMQKANAETSPESAGGAAGLVHRTEPAHNAPAQRAQRRRGSRRCAVLHAQMLRTLEAQAMAAGHGSNFKRRV